MAFILHRGGVYLAPSGAGKTTGARRGRWADGDDIIRSTIGWPKTPRWWLDRDLSHKVHLANANALSAYAATSSVPILFNGDWPEEANGRPAGVIIPTASWLIANLASHHRLKRETWDELVSQVPISQLRLAQLARRYHLPLLVGLAADDFMRG